MFAAAFQPSIEDEGPFAKSPDRATRNGGQGPKYRSSAKEQIFDEGSGAQHEHDDDKQRNHAERPTPDDIIRVMEHDIAHHSLPQPPRFHAPCAASGQRRTASAEPGRPSIPLGSAVR